MVVLVWGSLSLAVVALTVPSQVWNQDLPIHIATGQYVLSRGWVPSTDIFSFTAADREFIAQEWLSGVIFFLVDHYSGVAGLIVLKVILAGLTYLLVYHTARQLGAKYSVLLPTFAVLLYIVTVRVVVRPQLFSSLWLAFYLWIFFRYRTGRCNPRWLYVLPLAQAVWANLHGGHIVGLALLGCLALGEAILWARARYFGLGVAQALPRAEVVRLALLVPACVATACLTPYGPKLLVFPFMITGLDWVMEQTLEWQPPYVKNYFSPWFYGYVGLIVMLWVTFFARYADRAQDRSLANRGLRLMLWVVGLGLLFTMPQAPSVPWVSPVLAILLYSLLGLFVVSAIVNIRTIDVTQAGIMILFFFMSLRYSRAVTDAALMTYPILTASASALLDERERVAAPRERSSRTAVIMGACLLLALAAHTAIFSYAEDFSPEGWRQQQAFGESTLTPATHACAVDFMLRHGLTGHAFTTMGLSSLLIYRLSPAVKINIDIRDYVYGESLSNEYYGALSSPTAMQSYLARYRVDFVLLEHASHAAGIWTSVLSRADVHEFFPTDAWAPIHLDDRIVILVPRRPDMDTLIQREGYRVIWPREETPVTEDNARQVLEEAERALQNCPGGASFAHVYKAAALQRLYRDRKP